MGPYGPQPGPGPNPDWVPTRARADGSPDLCNFLKAVTDGGPPGFPRLPPEGSPSLRRQKPDARNQSFGAISHVSGS